MGNVNINKQQQKTNDAKYTTKKIPGEQNETEVRVNEKEIESKAAVRNDFGHSQHTNVL